MLEILVPQILAQIASVGVEKAIDWAAKQIQLMSKEQATQLNQKGKAGDTGFSVRHTFPKGHVGYVLIRLLNLKDSAEVVIIWGPWVRRLVLDPISVVAERQRRGSPRGSLYKETICGIRPPSYQH